MNMGADFESYIPNGDQRRSYTTVHKYRGYLMRMLGEDKAKEYIALMADVRMASTPQELHAADERYIEFMIGLEGDHAFGIRAFVDHSDCDGMFTAEECKYIAKAFYALLKTDIVTDEEERDNIEELADLFKDTADNDGIVMIW
jgi:hypothetical protein